MTRQVKFKSQGSTLRAAMCVLLLSISCSGKVASSNSQGNPDDGTAGSQDGTTPGDGSASRGARLGDATAYGTTGPRRLSRHEYQASVSDLFGIDVTEHIELLPADSSNPFDNDYTQQVGSAAWTEGAKALADRVAAAVLADARLRARVIGCTPNGADDTKCLRSLATSLGRRVLRRPLTPAEIGRYVEVASKVAATQKNADAGLSVVMRALLCDLEFLNRVEIGEPVPGDARARRLTSHEVATRLSFLLWGTTPNDDLLALADKNELLSASQIRDAAATLLASPRAKAHVQRFFAQWLGYEHLPHSASLSASLRRETDALVGKILFEEKRPWVDLFKSTETYVDDELAARYGLPKPGKVAWVSYGNSGRRGILSHGSVLSNGAKFGDTSPVARGLYVLRRLLCQDVASPPPELQVDTDSAPKGKDPNACKADRYKMHSEGGCAGCHKLIDGIGFGLERYDHTGAFRTTEPGRSDCPIAGQGNLVDVGAFAGPAELGERLLASGLLESCFLNQLFQSMAGRPGSEADGPAREALADVFVKSGHQFDSLLLDFVSANAFRNRLLQGDAQ